MRIPEKRLCDLCRNELVPGEQVIGLNYPLDAQDVDLFLPRSGVTIHEMLPGLSRIPFVAKPNAFIFEICRPCIDAILPMLKELKTELLRDQLAERDRRAGARSSE